MKIKIKNLSKNYGNLLALDNINLEIEEGMYGLLGPNGAGKTTLINILATLLKPTKGEVFIDNVDVLKNPEKIRKLIGFLPQEYGLYNNVNIEDFLNYVGVLKGICKDDLKKEVKRVLSLVNLMNKRKEKIKNLSGGMKQRVGIAQALMGDPKIIIVDEPTVGLDPEERSKFLNLLTTMSIRKIIIFSTHIVSDIEGSCNNLCILNKGKVLYKGDVSGLQSYSQNKLFEVKINPEQFVELENRYNIISVKREEDFLLVRLFSNEEIKDARLLEPTLEGGYYSLLSDYCEHV